MKYKVGDRVKVVGERELFAGCEGYICEVNCEFGDYLLDMYKGNDRITQDECDMYLVYFDEKELEIIE